VRRNTAEPRRDCRVNPAPIRILEQPPLVILMPLSGSEKASNDWQLMALSHDGRIGSFDGF
jgi:hypothetical protein